MQWVGYLTLDDLTENVLKIKIIYVGRPVPHFE